MESLKTQRISYPNYDTKEDFMFNKKQETTSPQFENFDTLIGKKATFEGTMRIQEPIRVDGVFQGEIISESDVVIGEGAEIKGNIQCNNILLAGKIHGNIEASGQLHIAGTGSLYGDAMIQSFIVDEKGIFEGNCQMKKSKETKQPSPEDLSSTHKHSSDQKNTQKKQSS